MCLRLVPAFAVVMGNGCGETDESSTKRPSPARLETPINTAGLRPGVERFCGACHAVPDPQTFPRAAWYDEVQQGYDLYWASGRTDLEPPPQQDVLADYQALAPQNLTVPAPLGRPGDSPVPFTPAAVDLPAGGRDPAVSHVRWWPSSPSYRADAGREQDEPRALLVTDMASGEVCRIEFIGRSVTTTKLAKLSNPAHVEPADLDRDGRPDFLVAELGSLLPQDHSNGKVVWLRPAMSVNGEGESYEPIVLQESLGRVADVQAADFDGDGDLDLVVAEFGWRSTGRILLLVQTGMNRGVPQFERNVVDQRHGTIHVPVIDVNDDGRTDFVALISQEHESIEAFVNRGDNTFTSEKIYEAGDPSAGSSGIQLVDLDFDGDLDVLYTNGDMLDSFYLKPYHAVHWLENRGKYPYRHHLLTKMPGATRAVAADLDGDGDLDVAVCAYQPRQQLRDEPSVRLDTLIWLEQVSPGRFSRRHLENSLQGHLAMDVGDFDGDGRVDLAVGNYGPAVGNDSGWLSVWWNEGRRGDD